MQLQFHLCYSGGGHLKLLLHIRRRRCCRRLARLQFLMVHNELLGPRYALLVDVETLLGKRRGAIIDGETIEEGGCRLGTTVAGGGLNADGGAATNRRCFALGIVHQCAIIDHVVAQH